MMILVPTFSSLKTYLLLIGMTAQLDDIFYIVASEVARCTLTPTDDFTLLRQYLQKLQSCISRETLVAEFVDIHYTEISKVHFRLKQPPLSSDPILVSFNDKIFKKLLGTSKHIPTFVTRLFENFIKGITYFHIQSQTERVLPIYHRLQACGPGDDAFRRTFQQCTPDMQPIHRADVKRRIERCYIERLIYDNMYTELSLHFPTVGTDDQGQDTNHTYRLQIVKNDFKTCFPNLDIDIDMKYDMNIPYSIVITRKMHDKIESVEEYTKTIVIDPIMGGKTYADDISSERKTDRYLYTRVQSFTNQPKWVRVGYIKDT